MVSAQRVVGLEEALALLRAHAFAYDLTLHEVAGAVVTRRLRLIPMKPASQLAENGARCPHVMMRAGLRLMQKRCGSGRRHEHESRS